MIPRLPPVCGPRRASAGRLARRADEEARTASARSPGRRRASSAEPRLPRHSAAGGRRQPLLGFPARAAADRCAERARAKDLLTPDARRAFTAAYLAAPSKQPIATHRATLEEVQMTDPAEWAPRDPRWLALYRSTLVTALIDWVGATALLLRKVAAPTDTSFSPYYALGELARVLQHVFEDELAREIARFWAEADEAEPDANLQTVENLSLQFVLMMTGLLGQMYMSKHLAVRPFQHEFVAQVKRTRLPGCIVQGQLWPPGRPPPTDIDSWLLDQLWLGTFWIVAMAECEISAATRTIPVLDPARDFPGAPFVYPTSALASIPPPSQRPPNGPIPQSLLDLAPRFRARDYLVIVDPEHFQPDTDSEIRDLVLSHCMGQIKDLGALHMGATIPYGMTRSFIFLDWLKNVARIPVLDLLVAEDLLEKRLIVGDRLPTGILTAVIPRLRAATSNPYLKEAIRRRRFLLDAVFRVQSFLPKDIITAIHHGDGQGLQAALPNWIPGAQQTLIGFMDLLYLQGMLCSCPEPFDADDSEATEAMHELYFASGAFASATRLAMLISSNMRLTVRSFSAAQLKSELFTHVQGFAATHAAWFHLRILRRFRTIVAASPAADQASALELHEAVLDDVRACTDLLEASGQPQHLGVLRLLRSMLEDSSIRLSRADIQVLKLSKQVRPRCPHVEIGDVDGYCWTCAMERMNMPFSGSEDDESTITSEDSEPDDDESSSEFDWGKLPLVSAVKLRRSTDGTLTSRSSGSSLDRRKKVTFAPNAEVYETWAAEDYPGRSMLAKDPFDTEVVFEQPALATILVQRQDIAKLPDLRSFW